MIVFCILLLVIIASWFLLKKIEKRNTGNRKINAKLIYCIICSVALVAIAGLRQPSIDFGDDKMYMHNFEYVQNHDFPKVFDQYKKLDTEPIFYLGMKVVSLVSTNYNVILIICAIPVVLAISWMIYKRSKMPVMSYLVFACAFFYLWSLVILRQGVAMGAIVVGIEFLSRKKYLRFIIAVIIATLFHRTALVFLLVLPLSFIPYSKKGMLVFGLASVIILLFGEQIVNGVLQLFSGMWHYRAYLTREESFGNWRQILKYIIYTAMTIMVIVFAKHETKTKNSTLIYSCLAGCLLCALSPFFAETFRLGLYFMIPIVILLPNAVSEIEKSKKKVLYSVAISVGLVVLGVATFYSMGYKSLIL